MPAAAPHIAADPANRIPQAGPLASILCGCVLGISTLMVLMGIAAMAFPGPLAGYIGFGIGTLLAGSAIAAAVGIVSIGIPGTLIYSQEAPATILGLGGAALFTALPADMPADLRFGTVVAVYGCITGLTGLLFLALGSFRLGELVRYVPFPVVGGMLAGLGILIVGGAMSLLTGLSVGVDGPLAFLSRDVLLHWAPAFLLALALFHITARWKNALTVPGALVAASIAFYAVALAGGADRASLEAGHWLLGPFPHDHLMRWPDYAGLARLDLATISRILPTAAAVILISIFGLLLHAGSLELAFRRDFDLDSELRGRGIGNLAVAVVGGVPTYHAVSTTLLARRMGAANRLTLATLVAVWLAVLSCGVDILGMVPRMVVGGLLLFLGLDLLREWLVRGWTALPRGDWTVLLLIVLVTVFVGYAEGIAFGLAAGVVLFLLGYVRLSAVKHMLSGSDRHSSVERAKPALDALRRGGGSIQIMELQGFLFFGTANNVVRQVRRHADDPAGPALRWLVLDLRAVSGLDWAAIGSFRKLLQIAEAKGFALVLAGAVPAVARMLEKGGIPGAAHLFDTADHALEWCEDRLLEEAGIASFEDGGADLLPAWLAQEIPDPALQLRLQGYLTPVEVPADTALLRQGEPSDAMYFIRSGRASVYVHRPDGTPLRVKSYLAGSLVGEIGLYIGRSRSATVIADTPVSAWKLSADSFARMAQEDVALAMQLHCVVVRLLGTRLSDTNRMLAAYAH